LLSRASPHFPSPDTHTTFTAEIKPTRVSILGQDSYIVGYHLLQYLARDVMKIKASNYCIVTDETIVSLGHLDRLLKELELLSSVASSRILTHIIPPGEAYKTREQKADIEDWLLVNGVTRDSVLIALGGGVVGDMVGFVAATFMRGIPIIQIPTTLLAMVDSAIGGKTAIDTPSGKNLVGAFHQPKRIFADLQYLTTLPIRQLVNGMAEVVKTAAFWSEDDFCQLEEGGVERVLRFAKGQGNDECRDTLHRLVVSSARIKAHVVTYDEKESSLREILNFGHSIGHAIEALLSPWNILHGEAISIGMIYECQVARALGICDQTSIGRLTRVLSNLGLPVSLQDPIVMERTKGNSAKITAEQILEVMRVDKKNQGSQKRIVLIKCIGQLYEKGATPVSDRVIAQVLSPSVLIQVPPTIKSATVTCPGSKSISNRALILSALGAGTVRLRGMLHSDDTQVMLEALKKLNAAQFEYDEDGRILVVKGGGGRLFPSLDPIYLGNAGTASRFLTTVVSLISEGTMVESEHDLDLGTLKPGKEKVGTLMPTVLTGNNRMKQRPIGDLVAALNANGCNVGYMERQGSLPLLISPTGLKGGEVFLAANISSQFVSSILMAAPFAQSPVILKLDAGEVVSQTYIDMTLSMMKDFGVDVERLDDRTYRIPVSQYVNPNEYVIEADASSATYPLGFAAISGTSVTVSNMGSKSLQGDSRFAQDVLAKMGCVVEQTDTTTTVTGPAWGHLKPLGEIDMEPLTDAFLTASALAAVANGSSKIVGIANQRVKECDRIDAVATQLAKFGVKVDQLPDGLVIHGQNPNQLYAPSDSVHCYDDHRVAMSFSILAVGIKKEVVIAERRCVEKTWPDWWDVLERELGVPCEAWQNGAVVPGLDDEPEALTLYHEMIPERKRGVDVRSIVFIGMRGAGKTTLGRAAAHHLQRQFIDMDDFFEQEVGTSIQEYIRTNKWDGFRTLEANLLQKVLEEHPTNTVVSCGGGIVESELGRRILQEWKAGPNAHLLPATQQPKGQTIGPLFGPDFHGGLVIHIRRDINDVIAYLTADTTRPAFPDDLHTVWLRRLPWFESCSLAEFVVYPGIEDVGEAQDTMDPRVWRGVERDLCVFLDHFLHPMQPLPPSPSYFLSLTYEDVQEASPILKRVTEGVDAVELRVDLLKNMDEEFVGLQVAALKRSCSLPIIFTVRSRRQGGQFDEDLFAMFDLLKRAAKWGCEYIDVEAVDEKDPEWLALYHELTGVKQQSRLIISYHDVQGEATWDETVSAAAYGNLASGLQSTTPKVKFPTKYRSLSRFGDVVKLIGKATSRFDNHGLERFLARVEKTKPLIALNMGALGQESRALCPFLTPVTHPSLPVAAAPGQLSVKEIHELRHLIGMLPKRNFYLFGTPIQHSASPMLHSTGFRELGFPHVYNLFETDSAEAVNHLVQDELTRGVFGGASVTIPLKQSILEQPLFMQLTPSAQKIGAVNTLVPIYHSDFAQGHALVGDNTDWLGITRCINKHLASMTLPGQLNVKRVGVVIGGGGTARAACFALEMLKVDELRVWNRTGEKAQVLASSFNGVVVEELQDLLKPYKGQATQFYILATVPASAQHDLDLASIFSETPMLPASKGVPSIATAEVECSGVVVELAYKPRETPLLAIARGSAKENGWNFMTVEGIQVLLEQGYEQFLRWTGRRAPEDEISKAVIEKYESV
jgi:pentafunctional AROM polypeptide